MRGQRYEINITVKDNNYKVEVLKNGWRIVAAEGDYNNVLSRLKEEHKIRIDYNVFSRLNEVYNNRIDNNIINDDTRVIEKSIRAFRGYVGC